MTTTDERTAHDKAFAATLPSRATRNEAHRFYNDALKVYRRDYREHYETELGNPAWTAQLEEGFNRGITTTAHTLHLGTAGLSVPEAMAHVKTTAAFSDMKRSLRQMYDHYVRTCNAYNEAFKKACAEALESNDDDNN
jgi:hypothetical protein